MFRRILSFTREAVRKVPALKYSYGVGVLFCLLELIHYFKLGELKSVVQGSLALLGLMVLILVFTLMAMIKEKWVRIPAILLVWSIYLALIVMVGAFVVYVFSPAKVDFYNWVFNREPNHQHEIPKPPPETDSPLHHPVPPPVQYPIAGQVFDHDKRPLAGVALQVQGRDQAVVTNGAGYFHFVFHSMPVNSEYSITFSKVGYQVWIQRYYEVPKTDIIIFLSKDSTAL
jgi:hypothetical protein